MNQPSAVEARERFVSIARRRFDAAHGDMDVPKRKDFTDDAMEHIMSALDTFLTEHDTELKNTYYTKGFNDAMLTWNRGVTELLERVAREVTEDFDGAYAKFSASETATIIKNRIRSFFSTPSV